MNPRCETCRFFTAEEPGDPDGHCRRYPPTRSMAEYALFPKVESCDWCGEYAERERP